MAAEAYKTTRETLPVSHDRLVKSWRNYTILLISRGSCYADIAGAPVFCSTEDMILFKPGSTSALHNHSSKFPTEYIAISVSPAYLDELSDSETRFVETLNLIPGELSLSHLRSESAMLIKNLSFQIMALCSNPPEFGHDLFIKNMYSLLILVTIRACIESDVVVRHYRSKKLIIDDIFGYISMHLTEEISLDTLEQEFFVSKYYICREFKRLAGLSPHAYIVKSRLNLCCKYIEDGLPINEVYQLGGFSNYNHFFRAFKNEYRMTPKEYYVSVRENRLQQ